MALWRTYSFSNIFKEYKICYLTIDEMPDVHERIGAQAQLHFAYNAWLIFHSFPQVWEVA